MNYEKIGSNIKTAMLNKNVTNEKLAKKMDVEMPIVNQLYEVLFENKEITPALDALFKRDVRSEF